MKKLHDKGGRGSNPVIPSWHEEDGIIFSSVLSDGKTGPQWIKHLEHKGFRLGDTAKALLRSPYFIPTSGIRTRIAIIKGSHFEEMERITKNVRTFAEERKFIVSNPELICLVRDKFLDKDLVDMGLFWLIGMHTPIEIDGKLWVLGSDRIEDREGYGSFMVAYKGHPEGTWDRDVGFLYEESSVQCCLGVIR